MAFRNERNTVLAVNRDYPGLIVRDPGGFVDQVAHRLNRPDGLSGNQLRWGRKARNRDGSNPNLDALTYRNDLSDPANLALQEGT